MAEDIHKIWRIFGPGGLIDKLGPDRTIRELKKRCEAGAVIGCSLYKLLIEKWIDVATGAKDPGQRAPAEEFMQSAGEDALVKKIEDLHLQYTEGIPRSIRMDVKDEWNEALERKLGRRIPLDPKDASKQDIEDSKRIVQKLSEGVSLPRPVKPKIEPPEPEVPVEVPQKKEQQKPPEQSRQMTPEEVPPKPLIVKKPEQLELMKDVIKRKIQAEEERRARGGGGMAGEKTGDYSGIDFQGMKDKITFIGDVTDYINATDRDLRKRVFDKLQQSKFYKEWFDKLFYIHDQQKAKEYLIQFFNSNEQALGLVDHSFYGVITRYLKSIRSDKPVFPDQFRESNTDNGDMVKDDDVMHEPRDYTQWTFTDFEGLIPGLEGIEDLEEISEYIDASDKLSTDEAETLRNIIKTRIDEITKGS